MKRFDTGNSIAFCRVLATILLFFPPLAPARPSPAAAADGALDALVLTLGATTYRIPRLTIEGGDPAAMADVFRSDGPGVEARLAALSARRIVIPELLMETRHGVVVERARYRDVILTDVVDGRVAVAHATAAEQTIVQPDGRESRFDWRGLSFRGVDLRRLAHVVAPVAASPAETPLLVLEEETIESAAYESLSGDVSLHTGRVTLAGVKARPAAASDAGAAQLWRAADNVAFDRFELQHLVVEGSAPGETAPFALRIDRIDLRSLASGTLAAATMEHVALTPPGGGTATLAQVDLRDAALATFIDGGLPHIGHAALRDVAVDLPTPQSGPESRLRFRLAGAHLDLANYRARMPTKFALDFERLFVDLAARGDAGLAAHLRALGYDSLDLSADAAGAWDEKTGDLVVDPVRLTAGDMGTATLAATIGNLSALAFSSTPLVARAAASAAAIKSLDLTIEGGGLVERLMRREAAAAPTAPDKPRADAGQFMREFIAQNIGAGPNARRVGDAVSDYLRAPQHLHLRLSGKPSVNALDFLARKPADIFEGLEVEATTRAKGL